MQTNSHPDIEFRNVSLSFDKTQALKDVSFRLDPGEMIFLTGASAAGKSVLLHLAIGLIKPDEGQILVKGQEIENLGESELLAVRGGLMGIVFQEDSLFTGLSVYDNVAYRLEEHEWDEEDIKKEVADVLRFVGLQGEEEKFPEELSGGMKRRVEIARAMIGWPSIMLFDEPTISLDPIVAAQVTELILRARDINKISSIYVTKKLYEIPYLAGYRAEQDASGGVMVRKAPKDELPRTRVLVLDSGSLVYDGNVAEFQTSTHPSIAELIAFEQHAHSVEPYFPDPWDKKRRAKDEIL